MSEFEVAVSNSRMTAPVVKNAPDASAGKLGSKMGASMSQTNFTASEFSAAVTNTRAGEACPSKMWPDAAAGGYRSGGTRNDGGVQDNQSYMPGSEFNAGVVAQGTPQRSMNADGELGSAPSGNLPKTPTNSMV